MINFSNPSSDPAAWNSRESLEVRETGISALPSPPYDPRDREALPAGRGRFPVGPWETTAGIINQTFRSYYYLFEESLRHSRQNAVRCRQDPVIEQAVKEATIPVAQLSWTIDPTDETNPAELDAARKVTAAIKKTPRLQMMLRSLLEGLWNGRAAVQMTYKWDSTDPSMMVVKDWEPLPPDSLVPRWSRDDWGLMVGPGFSGETESYNLGRVHYFTPEEMEAILIHQGDREPADYFDTTLTGSITGIGWRAKVYWYWFVRSNILANMLDLVERLGNGVWIAGFDQSNPDGRANWERALADYRDKRVLMRPVDRDGKSSYNLEILDPAATTTANLEGLIRYFDGIIRSVILGHPLGAGAEINIGGDPAAIYGDAVTRSTKYHAVNLAETLTYRWLPILYKYCCPGVQPGVFKFSTDHPNAKAVLEAAERLGAMNYPIDLDFVASINGIPKGHTGANLYSKVQGLSPMAVSTPPSGVPMATGTSAPPQQTADAQAVTSPSQAPLQ